MNASLTSVQDGRENHFLTGTLRRVRGTYLMVQRDLGLVGLKASWIGLHMLPDRTSRQWTDESDFDYSADIYNNAGKYCMALIGEASQYFLAGFWFEDSCIAEREFICSKSSVYMSSK